jgi:Cys-tRNA(Pro)/Cys-tRNA(Cys) deacylase
MQAAQALGRLPSTVFKTLVVALDSGELICAIVPSDARLNLKAIVAAAGGSKAQLSDPKKAERSTGYVIGGISPVGQRKRLRAFLDASAPPLDEMVVNGGRRGLQIVLKPADLILATSAVVVLCSDALRAAPLADQAALEFRRIVRGDWPSVRRKARRIRSRSPKPVSSAMASME